MMTGIDLQPAPMQLSPEAMQAAQQDPAIAAQIKAKMEEAQVAPAALQILRGDMEREYRIDIETDSTIQADVQQAQTNASQFIQGLNGYFTAIGPAVQAGMVQADEAADILMSLARSFKLGRQAEDAIERIGKRAADQAKQPQQPKPDPAAEQAKAEMAAKQAEMQMKGQEAQAKFQLEQQRFGFEQQKHADTMGLEQQKMQAEMALKERQMAMEHEFKREGLMSGETLKREEMTMRQMHEREMAGHAGEVADYAKSSTAKQVGGLMKDLAPALQAVGEGLATLGNEMRAGMEQQAQATAALAQAAMAETELVRDPTTGRAAGARKKPPTMVM